MKHKWGFHSTVYSEQFVTQVTNLPVFIKQYDNKIAYWAHCMAFALY
jgi:hypothetical protein